MLNHITLFHINITALIMAIAGFLFTFGAMFARWKYTVKTKKHVEVSSDSKIAIENVKLTKIRNIFVKTALLCYLFAMLMIFFYSYIFSTAVKHGAYGDFYKKNTLNEVFHNIQYGFIDQSEELPEDISGSVIIFFKWGCKDCSNIHNELLTKLEEYDLFKTYFVSSRSDRGKKLLESYPMDAVPSGIYVYYDMSNGVPYQGFILNDGAKLNEYNLDTLLSVQTYIRCFELPDAYREDAMSELPEKYKDPVTESEE